MQAAWAKQRAAGAYDNKKWAGFDKKRSHKDRIECKNGVVEAVVGDPDQTYKCKNIVIVCSRVSLSPLISSKDMYDFKTHAELGGPADEGSGSWGWSKKGRDFIAIGQTCMWNASFMNQQKY